jgi:membrane associated rhomboid family serine protease
MFIPLKDENPTRGIPIITISLIVINAAVYFYSFLKGTPGFEAFLYQFGLIPIEITHFAELTPRLAAPIWLTPLTSMFLHGSFMHLGGNMLFLWVFGNNIEDHLGPLKFLLFYLAAGLVAVAAFVIFNPNSNVPMVGASGAIAGVMGAYMFLFPRARVLTFIFLFYFIRIVRVPAAVVLGFWIFYQIIMSAMSSGIGGGVAWLAHVGGFAFGWLWFRIFSNGGIGGGQKVYRLEWH